MSARNGIRVSVLVLGVLVAAAESTWADWEPPPPPKPARIKAGEGFPPGGPLPGPVTPVRRTEKKREPAKPALVGKIQYGTEKWITTEDGRRFSFLDWRSDTTDIYLLLNFANSKLGLNYRYIETPLASFSWNPAELPVLYFTGHDDFTFTDDELAHLGWYLRDGGTLIGDACCGANAFAQAFARNVKQIFPERPFREIAADDPLYRCFYEIDDVVYKDEGKDPLAGKPNLRGMNIGCRIAVMLSTHDMSCGWAQHEHPQGKRIAADDATRIGTNIITYVLANYQYAKCYSTQKIYHEENVGEPPRGRPQPREQFVLGQVVHGGDWDPNPTAVPNLLKHLAAGSTIDVAFARADVDLRKLDVFRHPFIYMTGHDDFELTDQEVASLRGYFANGGVMLANACCGRAAFDSAFRREMHRVLPGSPLQGLQLDHPIFFSLHRIQRVQFTPWMKDQRPDITAPMLEGVSLGGQLCLIYSRWDLGSGWEGIPHPYSLGYTTEDALKIGANAVVYALTH